MNIVIISGEVISNIDFRFIYDRFKRNNTNKETYSHTSIAKCKMRLINGSIVNVYGYDYYYSIEELYGAYLEEGSLYLTDDYCQFQIYLYDYLGDRIYQPFNYSITSGKITYELAFMIAPETDCQVIIEYPDIDYKIVLDVKC